MPDVIDQITISLSKPYFRRIFRNLKIANEDNVDTIYKYIMVEEAEIIIKNSPKEGKIKVLIRHSNFFENMK